jgi:S-adenosyl-L-methionine hydrolase (adenosine-forming)
VIDVSHGVPPFDVRQGALTLHRVVRHLGPGVVLAVVDPGVGTDRRAIAAAVSAGDDRPHALVGPDNGLLPWALDALGGVDEVVALSRPADAATTFDGRDLFAPVAARLWDGVGLAELGEAVDPSTLVRLEPPRCTVMRGTVETEVQWVDRFGNVQLAARPDDAGHAELGDDLEVVAGATRRARRVSAFAELAPGELGVVVDANGHLSVVCDRASAAAVLDAHGGDVVTLTNAGAARSGARRGTS